MKEYFKCCLCGDCLPLTMRSERDSGMCRGCADAYYGERDEEKANAAKEKEEGEKDTNLIAAAPALYDCLREAVSERCHECELLDRVNGRCANTKGKCFVQRWREALTKAAGGAK